MRDSEAAPLVIQSDFSILLDVHSGQFREARDVLMRFAELVKSPEHLHVYRITPLSLWNAAASGMASEQIIAALTALSRYPVPGNVKTEIAEKMRRFGLLKLVREGETLQLVARDAATLEELLAVSQVRAYVISRGAGASSGLPRGAPPSTHATIVSISSSLNTRSLRNTPRKS